MNSITCLRKDYGYRFVVNYDSMMELFNLMSKFCSVSKNA